MQRRHERPGPPLCFCRLLRQTYDKGASLVPAWTGSLDLSTVLRNDAMADRQSQTCSFSGAATREERLEQVSSTSSSMPQPVSLKTISAIWSFCVKTILSEPVSSMLSRALTTRLSTTDLISWPLTRRQSGLPAGTRWSCPWRLANVEPFPEPIRQWR